MRRTSAVMALLAIACATGVAAQVVFAQTGAGSPIFGVVLPEGYREWKLISVAHEAGVNNDIRAILGNELAVQAFRSETRPFPDGTIIARLAWRYETSARNDKVFPAPQSFVAGAPTNVQISVKDSARYAATGGWGYGQFNDGKANLDVGLVQSCATCHAKLDRASDFVFTTYSP